MPGTEKEWDYQWSKSFHNGMVDSGKLSIPEKSAYNVDLKSYEQHRTDTLNALEKEKIASNRKLFGLDVQVNGTHYKDMAIQPTEFILANQLGFCEGNIIKYVCRHKAKGKETDLLKARHYIDMLLESEYEYPPKRDT